VLECGEVVESGERGTRLETERAEGSEDSVDELSCERRRRGEGGVMGSRTAPEIGRAPENWSGGGMVDGMAAFPRRWSLGWGSRGRGDD
jgi:hypothetical protein